MATRATRSASGTARRIQGLLSLGVPWVIGAWLKLVEHWFTIKNGFKPYKQLVRRMEDEIVAKNKEEIEQLLRAGFIKTTKYVEWLANIILAIKRNDKIRTCIDLWDLNHVTSKDKYPILIADMVVDMAFRHGVCPSWIGTRAIINFLYSGMMWRKHP